MAAISGIYLDGIPVAALPLPDRGFGYGDGVFETLLVCGAEVTFLPLHAERLRLGLGRLGIPEPPWHRHLDNSLAALMPDADAWMAIRLTITRGAGERGYQPPQAPVPRTVVEAGSLAFDPVSAVGRPLRTGRASITLARQPFLAGIKHLNRLEQVIAARECAQSGFDDLLLFDDHGNVISSVSANLFLVSGGKLITPPVENCGIAGTRRRLVIDKLCPELSIDCSVATLGLEDLYRADEVFCCNSIRGIQSICSFDDRIWDTYPVTDALRNIYCEALRCA